MVSILFGWVFFIPYNRSHLTKIRKGLEKTRLETRFRSILKPSLTSSDVCRLWYRTSVTPRSQRKTVMTSLKKINKHYQRFTEESFLLNCLDPLSDFPGFTVLSWSFGMSFSFNQVVRCNGVTNTRHETRKGTGHTTDCLPEFWDT